MDLETAPMAATPLHAPSLVLGSDPRSQANRPERESALRGQVITPFRIARLMVRYLLDPRPPRSVRIVDPCCGPGTFAAAMKAEGLLLPQDEFVGFDIDPAMVVSATQSAKGLQAHVRYTTADFLLTPNELADFVIMNPPYVRQEWLDRKDTYRSTTHRLVGSTPPGTSNLYTYFLAKALAELKEGGRFAFIIYDSWKYTRFGHWLQALLEDICAEVVVESAGPQPFGGRLIDATILYGAKGAISNRSASCLPAHDEDAGTQDIRIEDAFETKRGLRLKQTSFFRCQLKDCDDLGAIPFLKKAGGIRGFCVPEDHPEAAILVYGPGSNLKAEAALNLRLGAALADPEMNKSILNWHNQRPEVWMYHRRPPWAPLVFNYYLRNRPRHLFNPERPFSDNFYGLVPRGAVNPLAWLAVLNSTTVSNSILMNSRNQGNGLSKIQLFEYRGVVIPNLDSAPHDVVSRLTALGGRLAAEHRYARKTLDEIDGLIDGAFASYARRMKGNALVRESGVEVEVAMP